MNTQPIDQVFWYTKNKQRSHKNLSKNMNADSVVVGGGLAGLTCAQQLSKAGQKVVLLEKDFCGAGASGKSSGFITPDSELEVQDLIDNFGQQAAKILWQFAQSGCQIIKDNIETYKIECDYIKQDSLFIANNKNQEQTIKKEYKARVSLGLECKLYDQNNIREIICSDDYYSGLKFSGTFGINSYDYCQSIAKLLTDNGVEIYEKSSVVKINSDSVETQDHKIIAKNIIIATDRFLPELQIAQEEIYQAQTFLAISKPLTAEMSKKLFPKKPLMVWDADLIYQYFRLTCENRILLGGGNLLFTYYPKEIHNSKIIYAKLSNYFHKKFPYLDVKWEYLWPGLIGVSRDFAPVVGRYEYGSSTYFISAAAGLPWAAALGSYIAEKIVNKRDDLDSYFSKDRKFRISSSFEKWIGKAPTFALSQGIEKYF